MLESSECIDNTSLFALVPSPPLRSNPAHCCCPSTLLLLQLPVLLTSSAAVWCAAIPKEHDASTFHPITALYRLNSCMSFSPMYRLLACIEGAACTACKRQGVLQPPQFSAEGWQSVQTGRNSP